MKPLIAGNWKMNPATAEEAEKLTGRIAKGVRKEARDIDVALCVPFPFLNVVQKKLRRHKSSIQLGAQDCFWEEVGAHTGSVSAKMLADCEAAFVVLGHSERRREYHETDEEINGKVCSALSAGLHVILAVGDTHRGDDLPALLNKQIRGALRGVSKKDMKRVTIAYEPVWAISTTEGSQTAEPDDALTGVMMCRKILRDLTSSRQAKQQRVMYGGSVNADNVVSYLEQEGVDGALPGSASLDVEEFVTIVKRVADLDS